MTNSRRQRTILGSLSKSTVFNYFIGKLVEDLPRCGVGATLESVSVFAFGGFRRHG